MAPLLTSKVRLLSIVQQEGCRCCQKLDNNEKAAPRGLPMHMLRTKERAGSGTGGRRVGAAARAGSGGDVGQVAAGVGNAGAVVRAVLCVQAH